jgi:ABC-type branched-subunit amino acid transport system ATPase component
MRLLEVAGLTKRLAGRAVLDAVSFTVEEGEIFGLLGPGAAGKTTCLDCLSGVLVPEEGRVLFDGRDVTAERRGRLSRLGVARMPARDGPLTARGLVDDVRRTLGRSGTRRVLRPRWWWKREADRPARLLLIDEPLRGLGHDDVPAVAELFATLRGEGLTLLVAERRFDEASALIDRAIVIDHGLVVAEGRPATLAVHPRVREAFRPR